MEETPAIAVGRLPDWAAGSIHPEALSVAALLFAAPRARTPTPSI